MQSPVCGDHGLCRSFNGEVQVGVTRTGMDGAQRVGELTSTDRARKAASVSSADALSVRFGSPVARHETETANQRSRLGAGRHLRTRFGGCQGCARGVVIRGI